MQLSGVFVQPWHCGKDWPSTFPSRESAEDAIKRYHAGGFSRQGYNDRLDESLVKDGKESSKKQSMEDRRDESKGMKKSKGKGAYSSDPKMS